MAFLGEKKEKEFSGCREFQRSPQSSKEILGEAINTFSQINNLSVSGSGI